MDTAKRIKAIVKPAQQIDLKTHQFVLVEREPLMTEVENVRIAITSVKPASARLRIAEFVKETEFSLPIVSVRNQNLKKTNSRVLIAQISVPRALERQIIV